MICPLSWIGEHGTFDVLQCRGEECAWWIKGEKHPGGCCVPRVTHYLAALLGPKQDVQAFVLSLAWDAGQLFERGRVYVQKEEAPRGE